MHTAGPTGPYSFNVAIAADHPAFAGHFPDQPLLPGVSLLAEVVEAALGEPALAAALGAAPRLSAVKFLSPVRPGAQLALKLQDSARGLRFEVLQQDGRLAASGQFEPAEP